MPSVTVSKSYGITTSFNVESAFDEREHGVANRLEGAASSSRDRVCGGVLNGHLDKVWPYA
jgi:hypothetical protein